MNLLELFTNDLMFVFLGLMILALSIWLYNLNNDGGNKIDLADLITVKGRINDGKLIRVSAFLISSWGFIYLVMQNSLTEWFFLYYMGAWVANALISKRLTSLAQNEEMTIRKAKTVRNPDDNFDPNDGE